MIDLVIPALPLPLISAACPPSCDPLCPIYALPSSFHQFKLHLIQSRLYGYLLTITIHPHHFTISLPTFHFLLLINEKTSPYSPRDTFLARPVFSVCFPFTSSPPVAIPLTPPLPPYLAGRQLEPVPRPVPSKRTLRFKNSRFLHESLGDNSPVSHDVPLRFSS